MFRGYRVRKWTKPQLIYQRILRNRWKLLTTGMPRLVLGEVVKILQRRYRRVLRCRIYQYATVQIQKIFRGMIGRNLMLQYRYERNVKCANIIKREYFIYAERKRLRLLKYRQHMAAYKIQVTHTHTLSLSLSLSLTHTHTYIHMHTN